MIYIGNHLSSTGGFEAMGKQALKLGADTFAFFTRNPRGGKAKEIDKEDADALIALMKEHNFGPLVAHAPYTMNLCSDKENIREFALDMLMDDMHRMEYLPGNYYNFHPGSHVGQGVEKGIEFIVDALNKAMFPEMNTIVLLETMAGKGSEVGAHFEELKTIIDRVEVKDKLGVCLDTCHVWDGGYDIATGLDDVLKEFEMFAQKVMCLDCNNLVHSDSAHVYRVGVANAADRGLDMYSNWGPAIQIKHLALSTELAESIVESVSSDRIVIVCKSAESPLIVSLLTQIGWKSKIQSVITENDLIEWYEKALRGVHSNAIGEKLLETLSEQINLEFPSIKQGRGIISSRNYSVKREDFWK